MRLLGWLTGYPGDPRIGTARNRSEATRKQALTGSFFSVSQVKGTINCNRDGLLYTSIPQNGYWSATVDGEPAEITLVGDAMIGLNLTKGTHTVEFSYHNSAFALGWKISLGCLIIFITIATCSAIPKQGKYTKERRDFCD